MKAKTAGIRLKINGWKRENFLCFFWPRPHKILTLPMTSVVTPQNQYFPANADRMAVHYWEIHPAWTLIFPSDWDFAPLDP